MSTHHDTKVTSLNRSLVPHCLSPLPAIHHLPSCWLFLVPVFLDYTIIWINTTLDYRFWTRGGTGSMC
ncbi:unnamed protein product [Acanthoscelides obtectus]|uniref:Uncharacterized protein n=1 Tax=Acanthoscelides obtectus TaxID=200917 RepID=A0A9P0JSP0_ACAOB|nr:unnamed protein product [Acanthoscelides obtectus]CAK1625410.1 hypothetical protein AOBTE_LOCUS3147 [Acanthoscelides obtectus]